MGLISGLSFLVCTSTDSKVSESSHLWFTFVQCHNSFESESSSTIVTEELTRYKKEMRQRRVENSLFYVPHWSSVCHLQIVEVVIKKQSESWKIILKSRMYD